MSEKIQGGYILLARKILESEIMDKPPLYFKLWGWMLLQAKFKPKNGLERGQFKTSIKEMQSAMAHLVGYRKVTPTVKQIRGIYESLTKGSMIGTTKVTDGLIITILKYKEYQDFKNYEGHDEQVHEGKVEGTSYNKEERKIIYSDKLKTFVGNFISYIQITNPKQLPKTKNLEENSLVEIDKLIRIDEFDLEYIRKVIGWAVKDDFWSGQVFSLAGLRKKSKSGLTKFQNLSAAYDKEHKTPDTIERIPGFKVENE